MMFPAFQMRAFPAATARAHPLASFPAALAESMLRIFIRIYMPGPKASAEQAFPQTCCRTTCGVIQADQMVASNVIPKEPLTESLYAKQLSLSCYQYNSNCSPPRGNVGCLQEEGRGRSNTSIGSRNRPGRSSGARANSGRGTCRYHSTGDCACR